MRIGLLEQLNDLTRRSFNSLQGIRIRKILIAVDGSERSINAVEFAVDLATKYDSEICLVHVIPNSIWRYCMATDEEDLISPHIIKNTIKEMEEEGERLLSSVLTSVKGAGIEAHAQLDHGYPAKKILQIAKEENFDLIVMGSSDRGTITRLFFGSISDEVIRKAPCPILLVKPKK